MTTLRLATWNIRKCVGLDRRRDPGRVLDVIAELDADIVALQEADRRMGNRPATLRRENITDRTGLVPLILDPTGISLGFHGNALLVDPAVEVARTQPLDLPGLEPRGAVRTDLITATGRKVRVIATHLGLTRRHRRRQLARITDALDEGANAPTIILGDFNEWSDARGLEPLADYSILAPGRSFHAARPVAALDRIAMCPAVTVRDAGVRETDLTRVASDHLPVWADVELRQGP